MEIIKLAIEDWQEYKKLRLRALKEDPHAFGSSYSDIVNDPEKEWKRRLENALKGETNWLLFAKENDRLVGMIGAFMEEGATDAVTIIAMYVPREERGKGISKMLMEGILNELSQKSFIKKVKLMVNKIQTPAVNLYKKFGFSEVGKLNFRLGDGKLADELVMEKNLS